jgi:hypothetical protein
MMIIALIATSAICTDMCACVCVRARVFAGRLSTTGDVSVHNPRCAVPFYAQFCAFCVRPEHTRGDACTPH